MFTFNSEYGCDNAGSIAMNCFHDICACNVIIKNCVQRCTTTEKLRYL